MATILPISSSAGVSDTSSAATLSPANESAPNVISNEPITAIRLLATLPVNLGQNLDASA